MLPPSSSPVHIQPHLLANRQEIALFGYRLPYLPDFLADHTLPGERLAERLNDTLARLESFVTGLRKYEGSAYCLRYLSWPARGTVDVYLLGRVMSRMGPSMGQPASVADDLKKHLTAYGLPTLPLDAPTLAKVRQPFSGQLALVEVRQRETVEHLLPVNNQRIEIYTIHPYQAPIGTCLEPFEVLLRQNAPVALSIYLEPTELLPEERQSLARTAQEALTRSEIARTLQSDQGIQRMRDPIAERVARLYTAYQKSLGQPFIMVVQVASLDPNAAWTVARAYASAMTAYSVGSTPSENDFPPDTDLLPATQRPDFEIAWRTFDSLTWQRWGTSQATPGKERLPYLVGARGAGAAFRFPISVRGGVPGIAVRQPAPDFEPGPRPDQPGPYDIHLGNYRRGGVAIAPLQAFTRHALVTGFTGSGKTNTVLYLLDQFWKKHHIPFLVIEASKKEYRALKNVPGFKDLLIFTLGDETTSPFRLNPFELLPGLRLEAHLGRLQACFDAALPQFGILPSIVAEAMELIYTTKGWKLTDQALLPSPIAQGGEGEKKGFPTMREMLTTVIQVAEQRGYQGETAQNIRAAAAGRIGNLLRGSRGRMFGCQRSFPVDILFQRPVILELNDLNEDDKALTMMFLLTWLREYRELHAQKNLQHITIVEEAHNVLSNTQSTGNSEVSADTKAKAVAAFANILAEVRAYGEGLIISDQSPEKLAPDAMRNTNLQIAHQLRDRHDREAIARAMIMDEEQQNYLGKLRVGEAAVFITGLEKATFITIPEYKTTAGFDQLPTDAEVGRYMADFQRQHQRNSLPFDGCRFCGSPCEYKESIEPHTRDQELHERFQKALQRFNDQPETEYWPSHWREIARVCIHSARLAGSNQLDAAWCYLAHEIDFPFTDHMHKSFVEAVNTQERIG
jgi:hypothetical protein